MRYLSVCSGIEAASVAWKHLGWKAVALSEIEKFPCEVLKHHYPDVPNLGDMTLLTKNEYLNGQQIDLLVGGTPCQSFSVAGLRAGLADERGNLSLEYIRLLEHKRPKWFLWENVPGMLSSNGGADFASILSGWTGRDIAPQRFEISGIIEGEFYSVAWRVLDSRYFGVPQRRRRIFVVGHLGGDWRPPTAVLFEQESLSRDFTPSRKKRKTSTTSAETNTGAGNIDCSPNGISGAMTSKWAKGTGGPAGDEHYNLIVQPAYGISANIVDRTENSGANGLGVKEEESFTLTKGDQHCVMQPIVFQQNQREEVRVMGDNVAGSLVRNAGVHNQNYIVQPIVYDTTQITHPKNGSNPQEGDPCHTLAKGGHAPLLVQPANYTIYSDTVGCLQARDYKGVGSQYVDEDKLVIQPIILDDQGGNVTTVYDQGHTGTLRAQTQGHEPIVFGFDSLSSNSMKSPNPDSGVHIDTIAKTLDTSVPCPSKNQGGNAVVHPHSMVRRLTPLECERLQGFPDGYSAILGASDSKRYAALGNSMTVNVMRWIGERIDKVDKLIKSL